MNPLLLNIISQVIPYVFAAWTKHEQRTGHPPQTAEDLLNEFRTEGAAIIAEGDAWKAANPTD